MIGGIPAQCRRRRRLPMNRAMESVPSLSRDDFALVWVVMPEAAQ